MGDFHEQDYAEPSTLAYLAAYASPAAYVVGVVMYGLVALAVWSVL